MRERAARMVFDRTNEHPSQWAAIQSIAEKIGCSGETLRSWVPQHSPWQRGANENTNGRLRQYFPKGTGLSTHSATDLAAVALALNTRPRKTLGWRTPAEALGEFLRSARTRSVATTA